MTMTIEEFVPDIIKDDEEKSIMFLEGAHSKDPFVMESFNKILEKYPAIPSIQDSPTWQIEEERKKLPVRERALLNCHHWGAAYHNYVAEHKYGERPKPKGYGTVEHERTGVMDAYEYMMRLPWLMGIRPAHKLYDPENYSE